MGSCLSCLGLSRSSQDSENPETSRLLSSSDPYRSYNNGDRPYRPHGQMQAHYLPQQDPETLRKDREAYDIICHAMSDEVVDVFTSVPGDHNGFSSRVQSVDQLHIAKPTKVASDKERDNDEEEEEEVEPEISFTESAPALPQEMVYKSIRKSPRGPLSKKLDEEGDR